MPDKKLILGMGLIDGYGGLHGAWRAPHVDPGTYADVDATVRHAKAAERGKFAFLFTPDFPAVRGDVEHSTISNLMDPLIQLSAVARETTNIGFVATGSTTFQEPFNTARQFKALDVLSHRDERYQRAHEAIQIVQALWGSWQEDAWVKDQVADRFIDPSKLRPINLKGQYLASRGPLAIPPSEQGQPVVFTSGGPSPHLLSIAGRYASGFIAEVWTIEEARAQRELVRNAAREAGRDPDEIKYIAGIMTTVAPTVREGLDRRLRYAGDVIEAGLPHLGAMLGIQIHPDRIDEPLMPQRLASAHASPRDPRSSNALAVAREGWSPRDVLAHGVIDFHPTVVGPGKLHADHLQEWFEAGAADGFWVTPDIYEDGVDAFVDEVVPILQERGIYPTEYPGTTLRANLGVPHQYGLDPRIIGAEQ
ncbi:LLM class flavin-dependent oxidoreductase [Paractinoplanes toevensis]|nr:LLM class flavin-dependent oxidoreductase [Actinoplanes toevensis]